MSDAVDRIKDDVSLVYPFFATLKPAKEVEESFDVIEKVLSLLEASKSLAFLSFWSFAKAHGPNLTFVESVIRARDDLDRPAANEVMDSIKRKVKEEGIEERKYYQHYVGHYLNIVNSREAYYYEEDCPSEFLAYVSYQIHNLKNLFAHTPISENLPHQP